MARDTSSLPVPLSPVIRTVRSLPCRRWICSTTRVIAALADRNPGSNGSRDGASTVSPATATGRSRAAHSANPCRATAAIIRNRRITGCPIGRGDATSPNRGPSTSRPSGSMAMTPRPYALPSAADRAIARPASSSHPAVAITRTSPPESLTKTTAPSAAAASSSDAAVSRPRRLGSAAASTIRRTMASSASAGEIEVLAGADGCEERLRCVRVVDVARGAELFEDLERLVQVTFGH